MKRTNRLSKTLFAVALCAVMTASGFAITVEDAPGTDVNTTPVQTDAEIAMENNANDAFSDLILSWTDENGNTVYPDYYAGAYINNERILTVLVTKLTDEVKAELASIIDVDGITIKEATYSYNELIAARDEIIDKMDPNSDDAFIAAIYGVGIYDDQNTVHVDLNIEDPEVAAIAEDAELLKAAVKEKLTDFEGVYIDATYGGIEALVEDTSAEEAVDIETVETEENAGIMLIDEDGDDVVDTETTDTDENEGIMLISANPFTGATLALVPAAIAAAMAVVMKKRK